MKLKMNSLLTLPAVITVAVVTQILFLATIFLSFVKWIVIRPDLGKSFAGIKNYVWIFKAPETYQIIGNTILMTALSLILCLILGFCFSLLLNRRFPLRKLCRTFILIPFFMMDAVIGIIWKTLLLHPSFGITGYLSQMFNSVPIDFFGQHAFISIIILIAWQWTPFFVLIILAGLQGIDPEMIESAKIDGANSIRILFQIEIPALRYHIQVVTMLGLIFIIKVFGLIYVTTRGGPGFTTTNLPYQVYKISYYKWDIGQAASYATLMVVMTLIIIMFLFNFIQKQIKRLEI
ncbi:MAG TPA: sugar ABC transporter permease [Desulfatiglandales bacterium]|nr:sugar ABC transporter permease [Desulfatiglandales bacterium]